MRRLDARPKLLSCHLRLGLHAHRVVAAQHQLHGRADLEILGDVHHERLDREPVLQETQHDRTASVGREEPVAGLMRQTRPTRDEHFALAPPGADHLEGDVLRHDARLAERAGTRPQVAAVEREGQLGERRVARTQELQAHALFALLTEGDLQP